MLIQGGCGMNCVETENGWVEVIPEPFHWGLIPFLWKRLTGYRDAYGRKAQFIGFGGNK